MPTDTHANSMLNIIFREYSSLSDEYRIIGFDDSPIAAQAILPISTVGQQIEETPPKAANRIDSQKDNTYSNQEGHNKVKRLFLLFHLS